MATSPSDSPFLPTASRPPTPMPSGRLVFDPWDPRQLLEIYPSGGLTCIGKSGKGSRNERRCGNPISRPNRSRADEILDQLSDFDIANCGINATIKMKLEGLIDAALCVRNHSRDRAQKEDVYSRWYDVIQDYRREQRKQTLDDEDMESVHPAYRLPRGVHHPPSNPVLLHTDQPSDVELNVARHQRTPQRVVVAGQTLRDAPADTPNHPRRNGDIRDRHRQHERDQLNQQASSRTEAPVAQSPTQRRSERDTPARQISTRSEPHQPQTPSSRRREERHIPSRIVNNLNGQPRMRSSRRPERQEAIANLIPTRNDLLQARPPSLRRSEREQIPPRRVSTQDEPHVPRPPSLRRPEIQQAPQRRVPTQHESHRPQPPSLRRPETQQAPQRRLPTRNGPHQLQSPSLGGPEGQRPRQFNPEANFTPRLETPPESRNNIEARTSTGTQTSGAHHSEMIPALEYIPPSHILGASSREPTTLELRRYRFLTQLQLAEFENDRAQRAARTAMRALQPSEINNSPSHHTSQRFPLQPNFPGQYSPGVYHPPDPWYEFYDPIDDFSRADENRYVPLWPREEETIFEPAQVAMQPRQEVRPYASSRRRTRNIVRKPITDPCYICYDEFEFEYDAVWCKGSCGQNVHKKCWEKWCVDKNIEDIKCGFCRTKWIWG